MRASGIADATRQYEAWLRTQVTPVASDLRYKHAAMAADPFSFLRASFYRWAQIWPEHCPALAMAPRVLAVGDLHAANFGTWHDRDDRLIWGVNDFDEAYRLPYTQDLVRLGTSILLAIRAGEMPLGGGAACRAIVDGYAAGIETGGCPFVLAERHLRLRRLICGWHDDPRTFWRKASRLPVARTSAALASARRVVASALPIKRLSYRIVTRRSGLGSLGRPRFVAIADHEGGRVGREVKAGVPSACAWLAGDASDALNIEQILARAVRCGDPFLSIQGRWICRRFGPQTARLDFQAPTSKRAARSLLRAMGHETANIHLGSKMAIPAVRAHLARLPDDWLYPAATAMAAVTISEWKQWKSGLETPRRQAA